MRKLMAWILVALMALSAFAFAEAPTVPSDAALAVNGTGAVRVGTDLYLVIPNGIRQMLVRVPTGGGDPACVDRGDRFEDLLPYGGGIAYLKTENDSSAIMTFDGASVSSVYGFGTSQASCLSYYGGKMLVLIDGLLHSVEPGTQLCLRLSGSEMRDYVLGNGVAYFLSVGDSMEYTAQLESGEKVSTQAGCVYSLDLNSGETTLLLKSGGRDLAISGDMLYFHNLADAYAVRTATSAELKGRVHGLDVQQRNLTDECTEPDSGFWAFDRGLVVWYGGALNIETEAGNLALYSPEANATVASDGENLYAWEPIKGALTEVQLNGTQTAIYSGDLTQARDLTLTVPAATPDPSASADPSATIESDLNPDSTSGWFQSYMDNQGSSSSGSGSSSAQVRATPIGTTPTPAPVVVPVNNTGSGSGSSSSGSGSSSSGSSKSSGGTKSSGSTYSVSMSYVKITGGSVNVRSGPGTGYSVITSVSNGTVLKATGKASKDTGGSTWYQVSNGGSTGWVSAGYAKKTSVSSSSSSSAAKSGSTASGSASSASGTLYTTGSVNVRSGAGLSYKSNGTLKSGTAFKVTKKQKDTRGVLWYKGSGGGKSGWVSSAYLSAKKSSSGSSSSSGGGSSSKIVTTGKLTIRSKPNKTSKALGYVGSGKTVSYLNNKSKDSRGVVWYFISYKGVNGWISSKYSHFK